MPGRSKLVIGIAAALAASAGYVRWKVRQAERQHPPEGSFVILDGARLHYIDRGTGQPVVVLHGNGGMTQDFDLSGVVGLATTSYRVIIIDRPGFGHSTRPGNTTWTPEKQAEFIVRALKQLQVDSPIVVGHSWGALVAIAMGLNHPDYVRSLVLLSGYYYPSARLDVPIVASAVTPVIGTLLRHTMLPLLSRLLWHRIAALLFRPTAIAPGFKRFPKWMAFRPTQLYAIAADTALMIPEACTLSKRYRLLGLPAVIMAGEEDRIVDTVRQSARLHQELRNSVLQLLPGAGHMIHHLMPYEVMNAIDLAATGVLALESVGACAQSLDSTAGFIERRED